MLTEKALKEFGNFLALTDTLLPILPFKWEHTKSRVKVSQSVRHIICFVLITTSFFAYEFYFIFRLNQIVPISMKECHLHKDCLSSSEKCSEFFVSIGWLIVYVNGYFWGILAIVNFWKYRREFVAFQNSVIDISHRAMSCEIRPYLSHNFALLSNPFIIYSVVERTRGLLSPGKGPDVLFIVLRFYKLMTLFASIVLYFAQLLRPNRGQYFAAIFNDESNKFYKMTTFLDMFIVTLLIVVAMMEVAILAFYLICISKILVLLRYIDLIFVCLNGSKILANYLIFRRNYRVPPILKVEFFVQLSVLNMVQRQAHFYRIPHLIIVMGWKVILGNVLLIRFSSTMTLFDLLAMMNVGHVCLFVLIGTLHGFGSMACSCEKVLNSLRSTENIRSKYLKLQIKSLQGFGIQNGPLIVVKFNAIYFCVGAITNLLVTILVLL